MYNRLQYISQGEDPKTQLSHIRTALDGGCTWIQLRFKSGSDQQLLTLADTVKAYCAKYKAVFIVNDHVAVARAINADGVHLGLDDMGITDARMLLGPQAIIGGTANTLQQVQRRIHEGCDYIGLGPFRFTATKEKLSPVLGPEGYRLILERLPAADIPIYAVGGIEPEDITAIMSTGVYGIAISGLISRATDKKQIIQHINQQIHAGINHRR